MFHHYLLALIAIAPLVILGAAAQTVPSLGKRAPDFTAMDINGDKVVLSDYIGQVVVLEWHNPNCPFVRKHYDSNNMQKLQAYARDKSIVWITINSSAVDKEGHMDEDLAKQYVALNHVASAHYILDPLGKIGRVYGAKTTPHMFIIDAKGNLVYMGAIDDQASPDPKTLEGAKNYVRETIDALSAGKHVNLASTQSYGCSVKYAY